MYCDMITPLTKFLLILNVGHPNPDWKKVRKDAKVAAFGPIAEEEGVYFGAANDLRPPSVPADNNGDEDDDDDDDDDDDEFFEADDDEQEAQEGIIDNEEASACGGFNEDEGVAENGGEEAVINLTNEELNLLSSHFTSPLVGFTTPKKRTKISSFESASLNTKESDLDTGFFFLPTYAIGNRDFCEIMICCSSRYSEADISANITNNGRMCKVTFLENRKWLGARYITADADADDGPQASAVSKLLSHLRGPASHISDPIERHLCFDLPFEAEPYFYDKTTNQAASECEDPLNLLNQMIHADGTHISQINLVFRAKPKEEFKVRSVGKKITNFALLDRERAALRRAKNTDNERRDRATQFGAFQREVFTQNENRERVYAEEMDALRQQLAEAQMNPEQVRRNAESTLNRANSRRRDRASRDDPGDDEMLSYDEDGNEITADEDDEL